MLNAHIATTIVPRTPCWFWKQPEQIRYALMPQTSTGEEYWAINRSFLYGPFVEFLTILTSLVGPVFWELLYSWLIDWSFWSYRGKKATSFRFGQFRFNSKLWTFHLRGQWTNHLTEANRLTLNKYECPEKFARILWLKLTKQAKTSYSFAVSNVVNRGDVCADPFNVTHSKLRRSRHRFYWGKHLFADDSFLCCPFTSEDIL